MDKVTETVSIVFLVCLLAVAYFPIENRLMQSDIQSLTWGPAVAQMLPFFLAGMGAILSVVIMYVNAQGGLNQSRK